jgi:hypothetical protein
MQIGFALTPRVAIAALSLFASTSAFAAGNALTSRFLDEPALVFRAVDLKKAQLPARVHLRNLPPVFQSQLTLACLGVPLQPDDLVIYLAESGTCTTLTERTVASPDANQGPEAAMELKKERDLLVRRLQTSSVVVMQPQPAAAQAAALCYCPGYKPPVANLQSGSPQQAPAGSVIAAIQFNATDADSATLTHEFFHSLDGGIQTAGLPVGLGQACSAGSGTLSCSVSGTAPLTTGTYLIRFEARDSSSADSATATLTVIDVVRPETVFSNGFEDG